jgi:hypothetical protein
MNAFLKARPAKEKSMLAIFALMCSMLNDNIKTQRIQTAVYVNFLFSRGLNNSPKEAPTAMSESTPLARNVTGSDRMDKPRAVMRLYARATKTGTIKCKIFNTKSSENLY